MSKNYFVCANSSGGFVNYFSSALDGMEKVYIIKGGPGTGKSTMMKKIGAYFEEKSMDVEYIHCSSDPHSLDGVIIKDIKTAVADGTAPHVIEPTALGAIEEYLCLGDTLDNEQLARQKREIMEIKERSSKCYMDLYAELGRAKEAHDRLEELYIARTDFHRLDQLKEILCEELFRDCEFKGGAGQRHGFFGALTPEGSVNYIENLTNDLKNRYFIKGRAGTGKSTFLKKLVKTAEEFGVNTHIYHCSFDPNSLDMVIFPELKTGIFDATPPHEIFPSRDSDIILDFYETAVEEGTDEAYSHIIRDINNDYNEYIKSARDCLKTARELHDELEKIYIPAVDFEKTDKITESVIKKIEKRAVMA